MHGYLSAELSSNTVPGARRAAGCARIISVLLVLALGFGLGVCWPRLNHYFAANTAATGAAATAATTDVTPQPRPIAVAHKQLWTCSMHPQVIRDAPGMCPICHMQLTPLAENGNQRDERVPAEAAGAATVTPAQENSPPAEINVDPRALQKMGVRTAQVKRGTLDQQVKAVGYLEEAEPNIHDVNLIVSGWIEKLYANTEGMHVHQGDALFELYSPEVYQTLLEIATAKRMKTPGSDALYQGGLKRLALWGLSEDTVAHLVNAAKPPRDVTYRSPISGHVIKKNVVEGAAVKAGDTALRIVNHDVLWLNVQVFEQQLPLVKLEQTVAAVCDALPAMTFMGKIIFIHPHVDPGTRTGMVRIAIPNPDLQLRPGMFATASIDLPDQSDVIIAPREAIIDSGMRHVAFVDDNSGHFTPREVTIGREGANNMVEVLSGLTPGETVVTSSQFLLDSESRLREGVNKFLAEKPSQGEAP